MGNDEDKKFQKSHWPQNVRGLTYDELGSFGVDTENNFYWDGKPIQTITKKTVALTFLQGFGVLLTVLSTLVMAVVATLEYLHKLSSCSN
jgi:hypothetical protein